MPKTCTKCGETKPLDGFRRKKGAADGREPHCKECRRERDRRYYEENRDEILGKKRRYYEENRDEILGKKRRYYEVNRDKMLDKDLRYREENRAIINQVNKKLIAQYTQTSALLASKKGAHYSPEEDALLLAQNGMTTYQKAITLGRTYESCASRIRRLRARANH